MLKVGLTGGIGSGKTTVANLFAARNVPVLDADQIARELVEPGQPALAAIICAFGEGFLQAGRLNRARLREVVFQFPERKRQLESILHPLVFGAMQRQMAALESPYCILCIPLLLETKQQAFVDRILVVDCPVELQAARVKWRDGLEQAEIDRIIQSQTSRAERLAAATDIIETDCPIQRLRQQVDKLHQLYLALTQHLSEGCDGKPID